MRVASVTRLACGTAIGLGAALGLILGISDASSLSGSRAEAAGSPAPKAAATFRLISQGQYVNTIKSTFGSDIAVRVRFAPVNRVDGLVTVGSSSAVLTGGGFDPLETTARAVAEQIVAPERRPFLIPCTPRNVDGADPACAQSFFAKIGPLLFRRPLRSDELNGFVNIANRAVGPAGNFYDGLAYALAGMLASPQFLYIWERPEADPTAPGGWRLDGFAKASRLSLLLWNAGPDEELLDAASRGDLHDEAGLQRQIDRMIRSPLYEDGVRAFFTDFLVLEAFDTLAKDLTIYPAMTPKAVEEAREQLLRTVVDHLVVERQDYRDLFTTRKTFLTSDLGLLYGLPVNRGAQGWVPYEFASADPRAGILTQIGFLAQYAHPGRSSATRRGRAIREVLLCQKVPDPPPNVDFSNFENSDKAFSTARQRITVHNENPVCAGCHRITDPIGLALENFDGAGRFRVQENGATIDASGSLDGASFANPVGLGKALRDSAALKSCVLNRLYAYSVGRRVDPAEEQLLTHYESILDRRGYRFDDMLRLMIADRNFFAIRGAAQIAQLSQVRNVWRQDDAHQN